MSQLLPRCFSLMRQNWVKMMPAAAGTGNLNNQLVVMSRQSLLSGVTPFTWTPHPPIRTRVEVEQDERAEEDEGHEVEEGAPVLVQHGDAVYAFGRADIRHMFGEGRTPGGGWGRNG